MHPLYRIPMYLSFTDKKKKLEQIEADQAEIDQIDAMIKSHIQPNVERLDESIRNKTELRDHLVKELAQQTDNLKKMERDAATLISSIRSKATKLNVRQIPQLSHVYLKIFILLFILMLIYR